jgi:phage-related protein
VEIRFYVTPAGNSPIERYLDGLEETERAIVADVFEELRVRGFSGTGFTSRQIDGKLWEIKVSRHRVFYVAISGPILVLLHVYKKQGQKAPRSEIDVAKSRMKEVLDG